MILILSLILFIYERVFFALWSKVFQLQTLPETDIDLFCNVDGGTPDASILNSLRSFARSLTPVPHDFFELTESAVVVENLPNRHQHLDFFCSLLGK